MPNGSTPFWADVPSREAAAMTESIVLLVEDNLDHTVLVQALLDYRGITQHVHVAPSVAEAQAYLLGRWPYDDLEKNPRPTLIILDHWLDDGTGLDLLEWVADRLEFRLIPIIVFTGCEDSGVREQALALGAQDFLLKPDGLEELGQAIENLIRPDTGDAASVGE
jgi:CheY-like chemotaxis protein